MNSPNVKTELKSILQRHEGRQQAITSRGLSTLTGYPDRRVRLVIEELITEGLPVASITEAPAGYFVATSVEEVKECTETLKSRAVHIFRRRQKLIRNVTNIKPLVQGRLM